MEEKNYKQTKLENISVEKLLEKIDSKIEQLDEEIVNEDSKKCELKNDNSKQVISLDELVKKIDEKIKEFDDDNQ